MKSRNSTREELIGRFRQARIRFQRRARFVRIQIPFPVAAQDTVALSFLTNDSQIDATALSRLLSLPKSRVSRLLADLEQRGFVISKQSAEDKRAKVLEVTSLGAELLKKLALLNNEVAEILAKPLSKQEQKEFLKLIHVFTEKLGAKGVGKEGEHPFLNEQRRLVQVTGTATDNYMGTGYEIVVIQLFLDLERFGELPFKQLTENLPVPAATLSRLVTKLYKDELLEKIVPPENKREMVVSLTQKGKEVCRQVMEQIDQLHREGLSPLSDQELMVLVELLEKIEATPIKFHGAGELEIGICAKRELFEARKFLVEQLVAVKSHDTLGSELVPESSFCVIARNDGEMVGLIEIARGRGEWTLREFVTATQLSEKQQREFFHKAVALLFTKSSCRAMAITREKREHNLLKQLVPRLAQGRSVVLERGVFLKESSWVDPRV